MEGVDRADQKAESPINVGIEFFLSAADNVCCKWLNIAFGVMS